MRTATFKHMLSFVILSLIAGVLQPAVADGISESDVTGLVEQTVEALKADAAGTIEKINSAEHPYSNKDNGALYVFVYDKNVNMVAHPKKHLVGRNYKGKPDVRGKKFRDDIVSTAVDSGKGWVDYSYQKPGETGIHPKTTYCMLVQGSDGKAYIVCSGKYK